MSGEATRRAALVWIGAFPAAAALASTARASSVPVNTVQWDQALERYLEAREAQDNDAKRGVMRAALDFHDALPKGAPEADFRKVFAAEEAHYESFTVPRTAALYACLLTAAPTMLALRQKVWIAQSELIEEVGDHGDNDTKPILSIIADDLTRLVGRGA